MRTLYLVAATAALLAAPTLAHTAMIKPVPIRHKKNPNTDPSQIDYSYGSPLHADGSNYPCKGYHAEFNAAGGTPVETWPAGTVQSVGLGDGSGANHRGGSCQLSLSEDAGATFKVIKSFIGACPLTTQQTLEVEVPKEAKSGKALFAWSWFNKAGQREMYMNCAVVTITDGGGGLSGAGAEWPDIFTANIGGSCTTTEGIDIVFPNPGKNVVTAEGNVNLGPPAGDCGAPGPGPEQGVPSAPTAAPPTAGSPVVATSSVVVPPSPSASASASPTVSAAPAPGGGDPAACSCVCGGPDGYVVNIVPAVAGISEGAMASRTPPPPSPEYGAGADAGVEGSLENHEVVAEQTGAGGGGGGGAQRRDHHHLRRHIGLKSRRAGAATPCR